MYRLTPTVYADPYPREPLLRSYGLEEGRVRERCAPDNDAVVAPALTLSCSRRGSCELRSTIRWVVGVAPIDAFGCMHDDVEIVGLVRPASRVGLAYAPVSSSSTDALEELGLAGGVEVKGSPVVASVDVDGLLA